MRISDALAAVQYKKSKWPRPHRLCTVWGANIDPERVLEDYPRPQMRRKSWISLNGIWQYAISSRGGRPLRADGDILVPFSPESRCSGVQRRLNPGEYLWYLRSVDFPKLPEGQRLLLHFGAVDQSCAVWWNGHLAGRHEGGYLPFALDVTKFLKEGKNTIRVRVRDDTDENCLSRGKQSRHPGGMFYTAQSGIWQTVWMEWVPDNYIEDLKITPCFDTQAIRLEVTLTRPADMAISINQPGYPVIHYVKAREFQPGSRKLIREFQVPGCHPWSPEHPRLYDLSVAAGEDYVESYFAMRKFSVGMDASHRPRLFLNNEPYFFHGVLDQGYWPESLYTPPSDEAMIFDIRSMKELGFNTIRKHVKIEPMRWYYHCDRIGMVVWQDMVNGGGKLKLPFVTYLPNLLPAVTGLVKDNHYHLFGRLDSADRLHWENECRQTVDCLYNCPCIGMWVLFNEGWGQFDALRLEKQVRAIDQSRLIDHASGWFDQGGGDIKSVHNYFRRLSVRNDRRPFVLTEYGGCTCQIPGHIYSDRPYGYRAYADQEELTAAFSGLLRTIRGLEAKGLSGAVFTQLSDVEEEMNGLYTWDRKVCKINREALFGK